MEKEREDVFEEWKIAKEVYAHDRQEEKDIVRRLDIVKENKVKQMSAHHIQQGYRMFYARKLLRQKAKTVFVKEFNPITGDGVYRNLRSGVTLKNKPQCFGTADLDYVDRWYLVSDDLSKRMYYYNAFQMVQSWDIPTECITCSLCDTFSAVFHTTENLLYCTRDWEHYQLQRPDDVGESIPIDGALQKARPLLLHYQTQWGCINSVNKLLYDSRLYF